MGRILAGKMEKSLSGRSADLNILFICNMPFRGIAKMTGGMATEKTARSVLLMVNGHFFRGLGGVIRGLLDGRKLKKERSNGI